MVQAAKFGLLHDDATVHHRAFERTLFAEPQMRPGLVVIPKVRRQRLP